MSSKEVLMAAAGAGGLPSFISSSSNQAASTSITITAPTGIQNGDLLLVVFVIPSSVSILTPPTGFNVVRQNQIGATSVSLYIGSKIASSESGNYTFTTQTSATLFGAILVYRNATSVNTLGVAAAPTTNGVTGVIAAGITPTFTGTLIGLWGHFGVTKTISTPPSGMTQRVANTTDNFYYIYDLSNQPASATGDKTLIWGGASSDLAPNILFQITNEPTVAPEFVASASTQNTVGGATLTINKPTGTIDGDLMVAMLTSDDPGIWTAAAGWTEVADLGSTPGTAIAYKVAASEGASFIFTNSKTARLLTGAILTYRYAAYDIISSFTSGTNPLTLPSISPSQSQSILIATGARESIIVTLGTPTSMTARVTDSNTTAPSYIICDQTVAKGPTGTRSMSTGSINNVAGIMLSIKPTRSL